MNLSDKRIRTLLVLAGLAVAVVVAGVLGLRGGTDSGGGSAQSVAASASVAKATTKAGSTSAGAVASRAPGVPDRAYRTLEEIDAGRWPDSANSPGTKGGDQWMNRDGTLAKSDASGKSITYKEWDVNPKQRGQTRDAERIVTGSDGSAYYTGDHYKTFTRMR
ncbi:ribonuclease domain-containing protein [Nocardia blacklockiae]|uniref:ribonuclease domain-containing protein n=1 Tax=Nocardia blacklockiae TaxID=480036 RepID=UPI00189308FD|nr:ribonuclease domain-containing protein [Nocardia blacklockiae]MBF6172539.1 ribonuclease [Nocardia blacklockiae]